jgi:heptosyltransferase-3
LRNINRILIIIQRSNGDVFLSASLVKALYESYNSPKIDLLINSDTVSIGNLIHHINKIYTFSYAKKNQNRWHQERAIISKIFKKYDLSINLTSSDRSVIYALIAGKKSISAVENQKIKSWWKRFFLTQHYEFDETQHIIKNNLQPLNILGIPYDNISQPIKSSSQAISSIKGKLNEINVSEFIIFHPSTQYEYKIYPENLRNTLLELLDKVGIAIIVTGGGDSIDSNIKKNLPILPNIYDFIGKTSLEEFFALSELSDGYIGMDTLNMHIAASQNKPIFAIFGPTNLRMWSPWSNELRISASENQPIQTYANITIFQSDLPCVACGGAGCNNLHGSSDCLYDIDPNTIFKVVDNWFKNNEKINIGLSTIDLKNQARKIILYIVYGDDESYYQGAKFSFLSSMNWTKFDDKVEIVVLTEKPEFFEGYPIQVIPMSKNQKNDWSLNGRYHFRIKNRGLAFVMDKLNLNKFDKILFLDTDTYFHKSMMPLFDLIQPNQALFYLNEGLIYERKRFALYVDSLDRKEIRIENETYKISTSSALWGSLMVGLMPNMRSSIEWADKLMVKLFDIVNVHTIEEFAISESLLRKYKLVEGKKYVSQYSTSRKKEYANTVLMNFFKNNSSLTLKQQIALAQKTKIKRPLSVVLKQRALRLFK